MSHRGQHPQGFGDALAIALTNAQEELWKKPGWSNEAIFVCAEPELLACATCGRSASSKCNCRRIVYCNPECQKKDWKRHKHTCQALGCQRSDVLSVPPELKTLADEIQACTRQVHKLVEIRDWPALVDFSQH